MNKPMVSVPADALKQVLIALNGQPYHIHELQYTRGGDNPIDQLLKAYRAFEQGRPS
jgi:hypothetical protein